jgi:3-keto-disaccharide hydrolase
MSEATMKSNQPCGFSRREQFFQLALGFLLTAVSATSSFAGADAGFEAIFDGKTLEGWKGQDMNFWGVEGGAITGTITPEHAPKMNQYLVWQNGSLDDFELKLKFRLTGSKKPGTNGGFQFRSRLMPDGDVAGYQVDNEFGRDWKVRLYDEHGRHTLAYQGKRTEVSAEGKFHTSELPVDPEANKFNLDEWHEYHLIARGPHLLLKVNGRTVAEVIDNDPKQQDLSGVLALQLHTGPPMKAQFKDILLRKLEQPK